MPELPEVETIARDLDAAIRGATIAGVRVHRRDVLRGCTARTLATRLGGARVESVGRRAKHVVIVLSTGDRVVVSPRFTGSLLVERDGWRSGRRDYTCVALGLADGRTLRHRDVRRLGTLTLFDAAGYDAWERSIGPEPLDPAWTTARLRAALGTSRRAIKTALMDQRRVAGIGNIYANEALWRARIHPARRSDGLSAAEWKRLHREATAVLRTAVEQRGTSFRDYRDPYGGRGGFLGLAKVYARAGEPCLRCGGRLRATHAIEGRITVWCPRCQRRR